MSKAQLLQKLSVEGGRVHVHPQGQPQAVDRSGALLVSTSKHTPKPLLRMRFGTCS